MVNGSTLEMMDLKAQVMDLSDIMARQENEINDLTAQNDQLKKLVRFLADDSEFLKESRKLEKEGLTDSGIAKAMGFINVHEYRKRMYYICGHKTRNRLAASVKNTLLDEGV